MAEVVTYKDLGLIGYGECLGVQEGFFDALLAAKATGAAAQYLLLCEHPHVYTLGRSGHEANLLVDAEFLGRIGATYHRTNRGGDVTYHGPGQLVGYPILDLQRLGMGLKEYVHGLEEAVIRTLAGFGVRAGRSEGATGVWLENPARKICAIGVRSSRYVTMHGFALNVNPQLEYFTWINPCGFTDRGVTSMQKELGVPVEMERVKRLLTAHLEEIMKCKIKIEPYGNSETMEAQASG